MTRIGEDELGLVWGNARAPMLICHPAGAEAVLDLMAANPNAIRKVDGLTRSRMLQILERGLDSEPALAVLQVLIVGNAIDESERDALFGAAVAKFATSPLGINFRTAKTVGWDRLDLALLENIIEKSCAWDFNVANAAIISMQTLDLTAVRGVPDSLLGRYVRNVARVATGAYPSNRAKEIYEDGLGPRVDAADALIRWVTAVPAGALAEKEPWDIIACILDRSGRLGAFMEACLAVPRESVPGAVVSHFKNHPDPAFSGAGW